MLTSLTSADPAAAASHPSCAEGGRPPPQKAQRNFDQVAGDAPNGSTIGVKAQIKGHFLEKISSCPAQHGDSGAAVAMKKIGLRNLEEAIMHPLISNN